MIALYLTGGSTAVGVAALVGMQARWDRKARAAAARAMQAEPAPAWRLGGVYEKSPGVERWDAWVTNGFTCGDTDPAGYTTRRAAALGAKRLAARLNRGEAA